jgi:hypothetical protein
LSRLATWSVAIHSCKNARNAGFAAGVASSRAASRWKSLAVFKVPASASAKSVASGIEPVIKKESSDAIS